MNHLSLFSGYGGFELGLKLAGLNVQTVAYVEIEPYCQQIIQARIADGCLDDAPIWPDIRTLNGEELAGVADLITAGFPCQPHSFAGRRKGKGDARNLWPDTARVIGEVRPRYVLLENVPGLITRNGNAEAYGWTVLSDLARLGYDCRWGVVGARDVGAPHRRNRWWCLADTPSIGRDRWLCEQQGPYDPMERDEHLAEAGGIEAMADSFQSRLEGREQSRTTRTGATQLGATGVVGDEWSAWPPDPTERDKWATILKRWPELAPATEAESPIRRVADGRSYRMERLKALGNGVVPPVVAEFLRRLGAVQ